MYDSNARVELEEMLGYERYVLKSCSLAVERARGTASSNELTFTDDGIVSVMMHMTDYVGAEHGSAIVEQLSPLIFAASYKLVDMIAEWIITENGDTPSKQFVQKIQQSKNPVYQWPDFFASEQCLKSTLLLLYDDLRLFRNALTHGKWGRIHSGNLEFDFIHQTRAGVTRYQKSITIEEVLNFSRTLVSIADMLVDQALQDANHIETAKYLMGLLANLHGQPATSQSRPRHFFCIRRTQTQTTPVVIDLKTIRDRVQFQAGNGAATFDLRVEAETPTEEIYWEIPFAAIPADDTIALDETWDDFRVTAI